MAQSEQKQIRKVKKSTIIKVSFLILYIVFLVYLYFIFIKIENNPIVIILILIFLFLVVFGMIFAGTKRISKLFQRKKKPVTRDYHRYKELVSQTTEPMLETKEKMKKISLEFNYRKSLIHKCTTCGMILSSFSKKCPQCGKLVEN
jgi:hypothetical protein